MRTAATAVLVLAAALCFSITADTPDDAVRDYGLTVVAVYVGDYNMGEGRVLIQCSNGLMYGFDCGPKWTYLAYASAMDAFNNGTNVDIRRSADPIPGETVQYWAYDITDRGN